MSLSVPSFLNYNYQEYLPKDYRPILNRYRSIQTNAFVGQDNCTIDISGGGALALHGSESFLSFDAVWVCVASDTGLFIDSSGYSCIESIALVHNGTTLFTTGYQNRLTAMLRDFSASTGDLNECAMIGADSTSPAFGQQITSGVKYHFSLPLPMDLIAAMSNTSFPLFALGSQVSLSIQWSAPSLTLTGKSAVSAPTPAAVQSVTSMSITNVWYNAKVSTIPPRVVQALTAGPIVIPFRKWGGEVFVVPAGSSSFNQRINMSSTSCKGLIFFLTHGLISQSTVAGSNNRVLQSAISTRTSGGVSEYWVQIDGVALEHIYCTGGGEANANTNYAVLMAELNRFFNKISHSQKGGLVTRGQFANSNFTLATLAPLTARGACAYDLDRGSSSDSMYQGTYTVNSNLSLVMNFITPLTEAHNLYVFHLTDSNCIIENGVMSIRN